MYCACTPLACHVHDTRFAWAVRVAYFYWGQRRPEYGVSQCGNPRFYGFRLRQRGKPRPARPMKGRLLRFAYRLSRRRRAGPPLGRSVLRNRQRRD